MLNKFIPFVSILVLLGCSKNESIQLSDSINIFQPKDTISFVSKKERQNSKLEKFINLNEILNAKSYNLFNSKINYPFNKKWQINTKQNIDDKNPYLPDPLFFDSNIYLLLKNNYS